MILPPHLDEAQLEEIWTKDFPGTSASLTALREDLIHADSLRRRARAILQHLYLELTETGLPMAYWDSFTQKQFRFIEKHAAHTQNEFRKALQMILSFKPVAVKAEPPQAAPPKSKYDGQGGLQQQTVEVSVVNGQTVTTTNVSPQFFLRPDVYEHSCGMWRLFYFHDKVIPPEYDYVLEHEGIRYEPTHSILISYKSADYREICLRELESNSPHLLDGKRWGYTHQS